MFFSAMGGCCGKNKSQEQQMLEEMEKMMAAQMKQMEQQMAEAKKQQRQMVAEVRAATAPALVALKRSETFRELSSETSKDPRVEMWELVLKKAVFTNEAMQDELGALFDKYDSNHNGTLEKDELRHILAEFARAKLKVLDAEEAQMEAQFKKQEKMMKGLGGGAEMGQAMFDMARQQIRSKRACLESQAKGVLSEQMVDLMYETLDKDKNGSVSKEEFLAGAVSSLMAEQLAARQMAQVGESMGEECKQM